MYIHGEGSIECMKFNIDWIFRHCAGAAGTRRQGEEGGEGWWEVVEEEVSELPRARCSADCDAHKGEGSGSPDAGGGGDDGDSVETENGHVLFWFPIWKQTKWG